MIIRVTCDHISRGAPHSSERCPVALAFVEAFPKAGLITVNGFVMVHVHADLTVREVSADPEVSRFQREFDAGLPVSETDIEVGDEFVAWYAHLTN